MSTDMLSVYCPLRYRLVPILATFVPSRSSLGSYLQSAGTIGHGGTINDPPSDNIAPSTGLIVISCYRATIQIPIATQPTLTTTQRPAVSSLKAYLTPAH